MMHRFVVGFLGSWWLVCAKIRRSLGHWCIDDIIVNNNHGDGSHCESRLHTSALCSQISYWVFTRKEYIFKRFIFEF